MFRIYIMNQELDFDDTFTHDGYQWDVEVDQKSKSQGQMSYI